MSAGEVARAAAVMRTALVGHPMVRFEAPHLDGPAPQPGRLVEMVEAKKNHVEVVWDDGIVLDTHIKGKAEWHVYRQGDPWRRSWNQLTASIHTPDFVAACFQAGAEMYRQPDRSRHPFGGRLGPDLVDPSANLTEVVQLLLDYPNPDARVRDVLVDQHVLRGIGNVYRCEVMWGAGISPWAHIGDLSQDDAVELVLAAERLVRAKRTPVRPAESGLAVYGRTGQACYRCRDSVAAMPVGRYSRMLYWCPGCQTRHDRRTDVVPMDPHPAARKFMDEIRRSRDLN